VFAGRVCNILLIGSDTGVWGQQCNGRAAQKLILQYARG
jgi:hypothetical protein